MSRLGGIEKTEAGLVESCLPAAASSVHADAFVAAEIVAAAPAVCRVQGWGGGAKIGPSVIVPDTIHVVHGTVWPLSSHPEKREAARCMFPSAKTDVPVSLWMDSARYFPCMSVSLRDQTNPNAGFGVVGKTPAQV
jgi:hypothetical protein